MQDTQMTRLANKSRDLSRQALALSACLSFAAMTGGWWLVVHLSSLHNPAQHDADDCAVCQQLLIPPKKFTASEGAEIIFDRPACFAVPVEPASAPQEPFGILPQARAPPGRTESLSV